MFGELEKVREGGVPLGFEFFDFHDFSFQQNEWEDFLFGFFFSRLFLRKDVQMLELGRQILTRNSIYLTLNFASLSLELLKSLAIDYCERKLSGFNTRMLFRAGVR